MTASTSDNSLIFKDNHLPLVSSDSIAADYHAFGSFLRTNGISHTRDFDLKYQTYFMTGGKAFYHVNPQNSAQLRDVISWLSARNVPFRIVGYTSNIMFLDEVDYGIIVSTTQLREVEVGDRTIRVGAGYSLQEFVRIAILHRSCGFEGLEGIPGTVGGGIFMNAGAYGSCISDQLLSVQCISQDGKIVELNREDCEFSYRSSVFKSRGLVIISAKFALLDGDREQIYKKIEAVHIARHSYQEFVYPTLGSMISISGDMYWQILRQSFMYRWAYMLLKLALKNPFAKFVLRRRPNNKCFNALLKHALHKRGISLKYKMSVKTANTLINDGAGSIVDRFAT